MSALGDVLWTIGRWRAEATFVAALVVAGLIALVGALFVATGERPQDRRVGWKVVFMGGVVAAFGLATHHLTTLPSQRALLVGETADWLL